MNNEYSQWNKNQKKQKKKTKYLKNFETKYLKKVDKETNNEEDFDVNCLRWELDPVYHYELDKVLYTKFEASRKNHR